MSSIGPIKLELKDLCPKDSEDEQAESEERIQWNQSDTNLQLAIMFDEVEAALIDYKASKSDKLPAWQELRWIYNVGFKIIGLSLYLPVQHDLVDYLRNAGFQWTMNDDWDTLIDLLIQRNDSINPGTRH
ncbi:hypothetical protein IFR04_005643 [Cadophora malorum]|uniref:Uncharacterized protein n=1 Tax=Cadophora malorum TaxID=108018 RepID=A0A8H7TL39_9HELO|nr:hypothetical protein IFR04_005643 [Cadophora malorum]